MDEVQNERRDPDRAMWRLLFGQPALEVDLPPELQDKVIIKKGSQFTAFCSKCKHDLTGDSSIDLLLGSLAMFVNFHAPDWEKH